MRRPDVSRSIVQLVDLDQCIGTRQLAASRRLEPNERRDSRAVCTANSCGLSGGAHQSSGLSNPLQSSFDVLTDLRNLLRNHRPVVDQLLSSWLTKRKPSIRRISSAEKLAA